MREVDEHAEPVHLVNNGHAKTGEPPRDATSVASRPRRHCHCGSASCTARRAGAGPQRGERAADRLAPSAPSRRRSARRRPVRDLGDGVGQAEVLGEGGDHLVRAPSTCSRVIVTASWPGSDEGTKTDQNWAPTPPARIRGISVRWSGPAGEVHPAVVVADCGAPPTEGRCGHRPRPGHGGRRRQRRRHGTVRVLHPPRRGGGHDHDRPPESEQAALVQRCCARLSAPVHPQEPQSVVVPPGRPW